MQIDKEAFKHHINIAQRDNNLTVTLTLSANYGSQREARQAFDAVAAKIRELAAVPDSGIKELKRKKRVKESHA